MTITKFSIFVAIIALVLTLLMRKQVKNYLMSYLQNFLGVFFIISGLVKAVDPLGTSYKMADYFEGFYYTFAESPFSFLAPVFTFFSAFTTPISVAMIVFEIVIGLMLLIGSRPKFASWSFFWLVFAFTALTGFTYLHGYVPQGVNFFEFSKWGPHVDTNMKVTDCGCFGDFMKLHPFTTFAKDVIMLIPAIYFIVKRKSMHQLFGGGVRSGIVGFVFAGMLLYSFSNYVWDIPHVDFRPFKVGVDIKAQMERENEAQANVEIIAYQLTNKSDGKILEIPYEQYLKEFKKYPKEEWSFEQIKTEPEIKATKISEFSVSDLDGNEVAEDILNHEGYSFMFVAKELKKYSQTTKMTIQDTVFVADTVSVADSVYVVKAVDNITTKEVDKVIYEFPEGFIKPFREKIVPLAQKAAKDGVTCYMIVGMEDPEVVRAFQQEIGAEFPIYMADNILLKTIVRSNPGTLLLKDAEILGKWHHKKLPKYEKFTIN